MGVAFTPGVARPGLSLGGVRREFIVVVVVTARQPPWW